MANHASVGPTWAGLAAPVRLLPRAEGSTQACSPRRQKQQQSGCSEVNQLSSNLTAMTNNYSELESPIKGAVQLPSQPQLSPMPLQPNPIGTNAADILWGNSSNNYYSAGAGDDLMYASEGSDSFSGGTGYDILDYSKVNADMSLSRGGVLSKSGGLGTDTIAEFDIEEIRANAYRVNTIDGSTGVTASLDVDLSANRLTINGLPGIGSSSLKVVNFKNVNGSENADIITGANGANALSGGGGNDVLNGLRGPDILTGGAGNDTFVFGKGDSLLKDFDRIIDFTIGSDSIDGLVAASSVGQLGFIPILEAREISQLLNYQAFGANAAATFSLKSGSSSRTFLALNDGQIGFQANSDSIVEITGFSGNLNNMLVV
jgi:Ca2+-binding RTX toxin-like protein